MRLVGGSFQSALFGQVLAALFLILLLLPTETVGQSSLPPCSNVSAEKWDNCQGTKAFGGPDGDKYVGEFRGGKSNGQGILVSHNGRNKYVGGFKDNKFHGKGTNTFADGKKYVGEFTDDKANGQGTLTFTIENVVASIASVNGEILLGQSFLKKFKSWSIDNEQHVLILR